MKLENLIKRELNNQNKDKIQNDIKDTIKDKINNIFNSILGNVFSFLAKSITGFISTLGLSALIKKSSSILNFEKNLKFKNKISKIFDKIPEDLL